MSKETLFSMIIGIFIGGLITWYVSYFYYKKAGDQLIKESRKLKDTSDLVLYKLQYPYTETELLRDDGGEIIGLSANMKTIIKEHKKKG